MGIINSGTIVRLESLILSGELTDRNIIDIYDADGRLVGRGYWYQDQILNYSMSRGTASKIGTGLTVKFHLAETGDVMDKKELGSISDAIEAVGETVATIANGLQGNVGLALPLLFQADLLYRAAADLRQIQREEAGTP